MIILCMNWYNMKFIIEDSFPFSEDKDIEETKNSIIKDISFFVKNGVTH